MDVRQIDICVDEWQCKLQKLAAEYGETLSSRVKLAILYGMLPREVQEKLLDKCRIQWSQMREEDVSRTVAVVLEEVKDIAKARREQIIPMPMDISQVADDPNANTKIRNDWGGDVDEWAGFDEWGGVPGMMRR